ncbi:MAG: proline--tRNA ligase [Candidatus Aenigmatarchaeota archaeon]
MSEESKKNQEGMTHRKSDFSEWFSEVIAKTELSDIRYNVKGFVVFREWAVLCMEEMYRILEGEMRRKGHLPVWFPAVIPEKNFRKEAEHVEGFAPEVFWITQGGNERLEERLALRPTSETAMYTMYSKWIRSWRDLPLKLYQRCQVWRHETKSTRPFIRSREFHWIEGHDAFATKEEAENQVREDMEITENVMHKVFGIPFIFFKRPEWDKFAGAVYTFAADTLMPDGKVIQQPSTHFLGQNFSKPFGIKFTDRNGKERFVWQTCYGPAISRIFASVVAIHGDDKGLVFPFEIAPLQVIIVPIIKTGEEEKVLSKCEFVRSILEKENLRVKIDYSENTPGWKFNHWEMKGVPIRVEIGPRDLERRQVVIVRRDTGEKQTVPENEVYPSIKEAGQKLSENLIKKADSWFASMVNEAKDMSELEARLKKGGFVRVDFCSRDSEGRKCAERIKERLHADVRGTRADTNEIPKGKCIVCGKKANVVVYVARQY